MDAVHWNHHFLRRGGHGGNCEEWGKESFGRLIERRNGRTNERMYAYKTNEHKFQFIFTLSLMQKEPDSLLLFESATTEIRLFPKQKSTFIYTTICDAVGKKLSMYICKQDRAWLRARAFVYVRVCVHEIKVNNNNFTHNICGWKRNYIKSTVPKIA